ncbi:MAG TPA: phosphatase PAP2 family protein [Gemmatimonadales bacterium]|nr:phosphatase PAP2 family protein [Gemmatimonadales bacterium]
MEDTRLLSPLAATHGPAAIVVGASMLGLLLVHRAGPMAGNWRPWVLGPVLALTLGFAGRIWQRSGRVVAWARLWSVVVAFTITQAFLLTAVAWKVAIPSWRGFVWDARLAAADMMLHGGVTPDHFLRWVPLTAMDRFYLGWFAVFALMTAWQAWELNGRYFTAMAVLWTALGAGLGTLVASAGPCYLEFVTGSPLYHPLMAHLDGHGLTARQLQETLWLAYRGRRTGIVAGISAFPSMHVAVPALYTLAIPRWRVLTVPFLLLTLVGSVALGWHYAIDGYAAVLGAGLCWWLAAPLHP